MARTTPTYTPIGKYAAGVILSGLLLFSDINYGTFSPIRGLLKSSVIYSKLATGKLVERAQVSIALFQNNKNLILINDQLRERILKMEASLFLDRQLKAVDNNLVNLSNHLNDLKGGYTAQIFEIADFDLKNYQCCSFHNLYLKKPEEITVNKHSPVASDKAFVGQTLRVDLDIIKVILFSDINHVLPVKSKDLYCNARGTGEPLFISCRIELNNSRSIQLGDIIYTSGLGGIFPKDSPIGVISSIKNIGSSENEILIKLDSNPLDQTFFGIISKQ